MRQVWTPRASYGVKTGRYVDARVELLGFQKALVRRLEILASYVEAGERKTLPGGLFRQLVRGADAPQTLAQLHGARVHLKGRLQSLDGTARRFVLDEEVCVQKRGL
jgi:hypothetical protein